MQVSPHLPPGKVPAAGLRPGKSDQSIGHLAKAAMGAAVAEGMAVPANAQGHAASRIARGEDPGTVFTTLHSPAPEVPPEGGGPTEPPADPAAPPEQNDGYDAALALLTASFPSEEPLPGSGLDITL